MRTQNVKLSLVPQRSCAFEAYLLGKIKLMMTMDPRQNGEVLMQKVRDMLPRAAKMITNEIAHSPDDVGLVIEEQGTDHDEYGSRAQQRRVRTRPEPERTSRPKRAPSSLLPHTYSHERYASHTPKT
jgi:hypothetical protein